MHGQLWRSRSLDERLRLYTTCTHTCTCYMYTHNEQYTTCMYTLLTSLCLLGSPLRERWTFPSSLGGEVTFSSGEGEGEWEWEEKPGESPLHSSKPASLQRERERGGGGGGSGGYIHDISEIDYISRVIQVRILLPQHMQQEKWTH